MFRHTRNFMTLAFCLSGIVLATESANASCRWTVKGKVQVRENITDPTGVTRDRGLKSIEVKVSGATVGRVYKSWGTVRTDADGNFSITKTKSCSRRHLKVQIRLQHSELKVKKGDLADASSDWIEIHETGSRRNPGTLDIGTDRFTDGPTSIDRRDLAGITFFVSTEFNDRDNFRRALAWYVTKKVIDTFQAKGPSFDFKDRITVKFPAWVASNTSYANGIERTAFIDPTHIVDAAGNFDTDEYIQTVVHEVMHLWDYDHNFGTSNWLNAVFGTTHNFQEQPYIAFHEGFAKYAQEDIFYEIWGWRKEHFVSRSALTASELGPRSLGQVLEDLSMVERNDIAVARALHLLTAQDIYPSSGGKFDLFTTCRSSPNVTFWDVLKVFEASPSDGFTTAWPVGNRRTGLLAFYDRAAGILDHFTEEDKDLYLDLIDPSGTGNVNDACDSLPRSVGSVSRW
jgi:hypothetical protein